MPLKYKETYCNINKLNDMYLSIINSEDVKKILINNIYYKHTIIENLEKLDKLDKKSNEYNELYNKIISVGEYNIQ
jgi:hypothetical protein